MKIIKTEIVSIPDSKGAVEKPTDLTILMGDKDGIILQGAIEALLDITEADIVIEALDTAVVTKDKEKWWGKRVKLR